MFTTSVVALNWEIALALIFIFLYRFDIFVKADFIAYVKLGIN
jgi:hypothetical protein